MKVNKQQQPRRSSRQPVSPVRHLMLKGVVEKLHHEFAERGEPKKPNVVLITDPHSNAVIDYVIGLTEQEVRARLKAFIGKVGAMPICIDVAPSFRATIVSDRGEKRPS